MSAHRPAVVVLGAIAGCSSKPVEQPPPSPPPMAVAVVAPDAMAPIVGPSAPTPDQLAEAVRPQVDPDSPTDTLVMSRRRGPNVALGDADAHGQLDKEIIRRLVRRNLLAVQHCYEQELVAKPTLQGRLTVQFTIGRDGSVEDVRATGVDPEVASCVAAVIRSIAFPEPTDGVVHVNYPFTFQRVP